MRCGIVPPYLLRRLTALEDPALAAVADAARRSLAMDAPFREVRVGETPPTAAPAPDREHRRGFAAEGPQRTVYDAGNAEALPGVAVRREGEGPVGDTAANEAYDGLGRIHELFRNVYGRASVDDENLPLLATVHYGRDYDNAFWDGERLVFGDGDGLVFTRFTASLSVVGHELTHGVTQYSANLAYQGQSGALNESVSDVFGALVEQRALGHTADEADWLIGRGVFTPVVDGMALRSMKAPGTAYDDDVLGK
ncbi:MAG TPA: M4 family metallopeptidase, partial [Leifsonia sp.]|nr:M4 family metallopeptidase [Leifsonia sp.]